MPAKQILEIKTVSDGICIDTDILHHRNDAIGDRLSNSFK